MHRARLLVFVGLACLTGCTTTRLCKRTVNQGSTLTELQYEQVLGNLALFASNPATLPWHVTLREGTTQITDSANAGALVDLGPPAVTEPQLFGSRTVVAQWGMSPVTDPTELRLLRIAYRRAHGLADLPSPEFLDELAHELKDQFASNADLRNESALFYEVEGRRVQTPKDFRDRAATANEKDFCADSGRAQSPLARNVCRKIDGLQRDLTQIRPGWFRVGRRQDVPKSACYVGRHGSSYAWVEADGCEALTEFTLTVLKLASLIKETQTLISPGSVKFSPGDRGGG